MYKVLFIASHRPDRSPNQRYRFEQYFPFLEANGIQCELSSLITESDDRILYRKGNFLKKLLFVRRCIAKRRADLRRLKDFDAVFICREALLTGNTFFEEAAHNAGIPMIYDFDDAIWLSNVSEANRRFSFIKNPDKTKQLITMADRVIAGNFFLRDYALQFNPKVDIIPSTIDTEKYKPVVHENKDVVTIGWSGSMTTIPHFEHALPVLADLKRKYGKALRILVIGDKNYHYPELEVESLPWSSATEVSDLSRIDIGIMPLPDDEWTSGKCGLKGLQYMAMGIPPVMSPVGVNRDIIANGINGFLPASKEEWITYLSRLIDHWELRKEIGARARETVESKYSVLANRKKYLNTILSVTEPAPKRQREAANLQSI